MLKGSKAQKPEKGVRYQVFVTRYGNARQCRDKPKDCVNLLKIYEDLEAVVIEIKIF